MKAFADIAIGVRAFGWQGQTEAGVQDNRGTRRVTAGYEGALEADAFTIAPGMARKVYTEIQTSLRGWQIGAELRQRLQDGSRPELRLETQKSIGRRRRSH
jgi:hypothetical protein